LTKSTHGMPSVTANRCTAATNLDEVRAALPGIELGGGRWVVLDPRPVEVAPISATVVSSRR